MIRGIIHDTGNHYRTTSIVMTKSLVAFAIMMLAPACGPQADAEDEADDIPGKLEYEQSRSRLYRLDRRIDVIRDVPDDSERRECGILTDRAYEELESTLAALDPTVDYGYDPDAFDCERSGALVYIEGFDHSPFECSYACCHADLLWAAVVYSMILNNFHGLYPTMDGEPYVAIEPDQPCP